MSNEGTPGLSNFLEDDGIVYHNESRAPRPSGISGSRPFQFVTSSGPLVNKQNDKENLKIVRSQAMRDYVWKQNNRSSAIANQAESNHTPQELSQYMGKYKLTASAHQRKPRARGGLDKRQAKKNIANASEPHHNSTTEGSSTELELHLPDRATQNPLVIISGSFDPFDSFSLNLRPESNKIIYYYHQGYSMNSVALQFEGDCFSNATHDLALFHSILYLVGADYDLRIGKSDSVASLYHGGEALRFINQNIQNGTFSDTTIAAVALMATRENLEGKFALSKFHMNGLQFMVEKRGGIHNIRGIHRRVVTWSDFCYSNVWNCQPLFTRLSVKPLEDTSKSSASLSKMLAPADVFGVQAPVVQIFQSLRQISRQSEPEYGSPMNPILATAHIYDVEYDLLLLNEASQSSDAQDMGLAFASFPLKIAVHLYLYLIIRELPTSSPILKKLIGRLRAALETQDEEWWNLNYERQCWLLWILFTGYGAAMQPNDKQWFVEKMAPVCRCLNIFGSADLRAVLMSVLWREAWCWDHCQSLWKDFPLSDM